MCQGNNNFFDMEIFQARVLAIVVYYPLYKTAKESDKNMDKPNENTEV